MTKPVTHSEQIAEIERLCDLAAQGDTESLRRAVIAWEGVTRDESTPLEALRVEAILSALGVAPAREFKI